MGITGACSTFHFMEKNIKNLKKNGIKIYPIMSFNSYKINTSNLYKIKDILDEEIICNMEDVSSLIKKNNTQLMLISPTSSNTLAKIANGISDTPVTLAAKLCLRQKMPLVLDINIVDGLSTNASNIGKLLNIKNVFFVPFGQSNPITKPYTLSSNSNYIIKTLEYALKNEQIEPIIL